MSQLVSEYSTDFSRGVLQDVAATAYPPNVAAQIINGRVNPDGTISRRDGSIRTHETVLDGGVGGDTTGYFGLEFKKSDGTLQRVVIVGIAAYVSEDFGQSWTDVTPMTLGVSRLIAGYYDYATMRVGATTYLFLVNGSYIWRWNGTAFDVLPNAPTGGQFLAVFNGRLYVAGHSGVLVQGSAIADPETWTSPSALTIQIIVHSGDELKGLYQVGPHLLVFGHDSTSYVDGFGEQTIIVAVGATGFSRSVGCIGFRTIKGVGENAIAWRSKRGIEYYAAGSGMILLSRGIQAFMLTVDQAEEESDQGLACGAYDDQHQWYHCALPTLGPVNNRVVVVNLLQRGTGWFGAPAIDQHQEQDSTDTSLLFIGDSEGYLTDDLAGDPVTTDLDGYMTLAPSGPSDLTIEDSEGYLSTVAPTDGVAASLFMATGSDGSRALHSVGYDGWVRKHDTGDSDDVHFDGTGGTDITLDVISRPFHMRRPQQRKRVRVLHLASINDEEVSFIVGVVVGGATEQLRTITIPATTGTQPQRNRILVQAIGDFPQVQVTTTDAVRITLIGISAELMKEFVL